MDQDNQKKATSWWNSQGVNFYAKFIILGSLLVVGSIIFGSLSNSLRLYMGISGLVIIILAYIVAKKRWNKI